MDATKARRGVEVGLHSFLNSSSNGDEWSASQNKPQNRRDRITYKVRGNGSDVKHCYWLAIICVTTTSRISPVVQLSDPVRCHSHLLLQLFSFEMRYVRLTESCLSKLITTFCTLSSPIFAAVSPEATPQDCNNFIRDQNR